MPQVDYPVLAGSAADTALQAKTPTTGGFKVQVTKSAHADGLDTFNEQLIMSYERARKHLQAGTGELL